ncbi:transposase [Roseomonas sp. ACRSG]|nr:transposase [Roseomonas sp. ACRSG]
MEEKATTREGGTPEGWSRAKRAQKDRGARWTLKRGRTKPKPDGARRQTIQIAVPVFGYKSYIGIDRRHGLIRHWVVTDAAQHDSRSFPTLLDPENTASRAWADTAYRTKHELEALERRGLADRIQFRQPPRRGLSEQQTKANAARARIRSSIEHVLAAQKHRMTLFVRRSASLGTGEDRHGQSCLQLHPPRLAQHPNCTCITPAAPADSGTGCPKPVTPPRQQGQFTASGVCPARQHSAATGSSRPPFAAIAAMPKFGHGRHSHLDYLSVDAIRRDPVMCIALMMSGMPVPSRSDIRGGKEECHNSMSVAGSTDLSSLRCLCMELVRKSSCSSLMAVRNISLAP